LLKDINEYMEDFIIEVFAEVSSEIGESARGRDMIHRDASIGPISSASVFIMEDFKEPAHMLIAINIPKEIEEEQTGRVITRRAFS